MTTGATMRGMAIDQADDPAAGRLTVVLADDASAMRALVRRLLEDSGSFDVVGEAADGEEAVRLAASLHPDLVLLDVAMPGTSGLAAIPALVGASPASRIVVLSALDAGRVRNDVLAAGADEFMEKRLVSDSLAQRLVEACRRPRAGHLHDVPVPVAGPVAGPAAPVPVPVAEPVPVPGPGPVAVPGPVPVPFAGPADEPLPAVGTVTGPVPGAGARAADGPLPAVGPVSRPGLRADSSSEGPSRSGPEPRSEVGPAPGPGARSPDGPGEDGVVRRTDWFRLAFDHSPIGMALVDVHGRFGSVNRALCEILGRRPADLIGAGVHHVSHPGDLARHGELRQQLLRSQASGTESRYEADWRFVRADGELAWTSVTCSLLPAGGGSPAGFLWQVVDLTARRAAESARVLTEELRERHENELTRAHTDLVQFATVAAHDLKSPLQVISGFAGLLEQTHGDDLDERGREFLAFILKSTGRMHALIDDLLAYAKVGADRRAPVAVPLDRVVDEVRATLHNEIAGSGASIVCDPLPVVAGDPTQLAHLLGDLVANALKFVAPGVSPRIRISASRMINAWCIEVADNGVGIDPQHRSYVFGMFQRLRRQEYEGTGIGLAICARIVEQRGGAIWVEDNPAGGSRFRFTVPDEPVPPRADDGWEPGDGRVGDGATLDDPGDGRVGDGREPDDGRAGDFATLDDPGDGRAADDPGDNGPLAGGPPAGGPEAGGPPAGSSDPGAPEAGGSDPGGTEAQASQSPALAPPAWGPDPGGPGTLDILLVEDDDDHARLVQETLANSPDGDYHLRRVRDLAGARIELHRRPAGCILLDLFLPDGQGLESLSHLTTLDPLAPIVILTSLADEGMGLQAVHEGAQDYLVKGTVDGPRLARSLRHAVERKALEARFAEQALHDPLTGLANRTLLLDRVRLELARNERTGSAVAVFYLDVDRFKDINDRCGHAGGDEVLVRVARRLARVVRPGDTVSRIGGDEFVVVCGEVDSEGDVEQVRARIVEALGRPLLLGGGTELISASIGVAVGRGAGEEPEAVIRRADQDMYDVKRRRRQERDEGWRA